MTHSHNTHRYDRAFKIGISLNLAYVALEAVAGVLFNSVALLSDAGHNLSDVLALVLAWGAVWLSASAPTPNRTFGLKRATILASLISALILCLALGAIIWESAQRLFVPQATNGLTIILVAGVGVVINGITAWMFIGDHKADLNIKGAYLHMAADALVSLGVVVAGLLIYLTGWLWIDPAVALLVGLVILYSGFDLLRESLDLAMDAVPRNIDTNQLRLYLAEIEGVLDVHDLHVWAMSTKETAMTAHLVVKRGQTSGDLVERISRQVLSRFAIQHPTIQIEFGEAGCSCVSTNGACDKEVKMATRSI